MLCEDECTLLIVVWRHVALIIALVELGRLLVAQERLIGDLGIGVVLVIHSDMIKRYRSNA